MSISGLRTRSPRAALAGFDLEQLRLQSRAVASHARGRWFETSRAHGLVKRLEPVLDDEATHRESRGDPSVLQHRHPLFAPSAQRLLHERADLLLLGGGQLLQREL